MIFDLGDIRVAVKFRRCPLFTETLQEKLGKGGQQLADRLADFLKIKEQDPMQRFSSKDAPFSSDGILKYAIPNETLMHSHLLHDLNILYTIQGKNPTVIKLYGVFTHDELGTGQPPNVKRQKQISQKLSNQANLFDSKQYS